MSKAGEMVLAGLKDALAHAKGEAVPGLVVHVPPAVDVAAVRRMTGLTQGVFASRIGVKLATLRNWEQKRRDPEGPALVLLAMLARDPKIVERTLGLS